RFKMSILLTIAAIIFITVIVEHRNVMLPDLAIFNFVPQLRNYSMFAEKIQQTSAVMRQAYCSEECSSNVSKMVTKLIASSSEFNDTLLYLDVIDPKRVVSSMQNVSCDDVVIASAVSSNHITELVYVYFHAHN
ncbi:hypothetical protein Tcan_14466, partial [Toxocara canis]